jgi:hypothetical protein
VSTSEQQRLSETTGVLVPSPRQGIVADLEAAGYLTRTRTGRRTRYTIHHDSGFRHPAQDGQRVGPFLAALAEASGTARTAPEPAGGR